MRLSLLLASTLALSSVAAAQQKTPFTAAVQLRPTLGGAILEATMTPRAKGADALLRAFMPRRVTKLLHCAPRCNSVTELPLNGPTAFGPDAANRVVIGGKFEPGQKVNLILQFKSGVAVVDAVVAPAAPQP